MRNKRLIEIVSYNSSLIEKLERKRQTRYVAMFTLSFLLISLFNPFFSFLPQPKADAAFVKFKQVSTQGYSGQHILALAENGTVWSWGKNDNGQLGDGTKIDKTLPLMVPGLTNIVEVATGRDFSLALDMSGNVWGWGNNGNGSVFNDCRLAVSCNSSEILVPTKALVSSGGASLGNIISIAAGGQQSLAVDANGDLWTWGKNGFGSFGNNTTASSNYPLRVYTHTSSTDMVSQVSGTGYFTAFLRTDGTVWTAGDNDYGQIGNGTGEAGAEVHIFTQVLTAAPGHAGLTDIIKISTGNGYVLAADMDGKAWGWGYNVGKDLGFDSTGLDTKYANMNPDIINVVDISGGFQCSAFVTSDFKVRTIGNNAFGCVGDGTSGTIRSGLYEIPSISGDVLQVVSGNTFMVAVMVDGTMKSWGGNGNGYLGNGESGPGFGQDSPVNVLILPYIFTQPVDQAVLVGQTAAFEVDLTGSPLPAIQWQFSVDNGTSWNPISGATAPDYTVANAQLSDNGKKFRGVLTNSEGSVTTNAALLTVTTAPVALAINTQPVVTQTKTAGESVSFSVGASGGTAPIRYQWRKNGNNIAGATTSTYSIGSVTEADDAGYSVVVTDSASTPTSLTSNTATLTVNNLYFSFNSTVSPASAGSITKTYNGDGNVITVGQSTLYEDGSVVNIVAVPATTPNYGFKFLRWEGCSTSSSASINILMDSPKNCTAVFEEKTAEDVYDITPIKKTHSEGGASFSFSTLPSGLTGINLTVNSLSGTGHALPGGKVLRRAYEISATNQGGQPVTNGFTANLTLSYTGASASDILMFWDGTNWSSSNLTNITVVPSLNHVSFSTNHFTEFAVFGDAPTVAAPGGGTGSTVGGTAGPGSVGTALPRTGVGMNALFFNFLISLIITFAYFIIRKSQPRKATFAIR